MLLKIVGFGFLVAAYFEDGIDFTFCLFAALLCFMGSALQGMAKRLAILEARLPPVTAQRFRRLRGAHFTRWRRRTWRELRPYHAALDRWGALIVIFAMFLGAAVVVGWIEN